MTEASPKVAAPRAVAIIGAGVIGRSWIRVFARAGAAVRVFDPMAGQAAEALAWFDRDLSADVEEGSVEAADKQTLLSCVAPVEDLATALKGVDYVQESAPERLEVKQALYAEFDKLTAETTVLASSSSALDIAAITEGLACASRALIAHPFNPPHIVPVVELLGTPTTEPAVLDRAEAYLKAGGCQPVRLKRYVRGFLGNRIQAALVREAMHLVESGVADAAAVDALIRDALALRWVTIGNFGSNHTGADGGIVQYYQRFGHTFRSLFEDLDSTPPRFDPEILTEVAEMVEQRENVQGVAALGRKRDRMIRDLTRLKREWERQR